MDDEDTKVEAWREWKLLTASSRVYVDIKVSWKHGFCIPDRRGTDEVNAVFRKMTVEDNNIFDSMATEGVTDSKEHFTKTDYNIMRVLMMRRLPISWNLDIPLDYEEGWLTDDSFEKVLNLSPPLVNAMIREYESVASIGKDEEKVINKQSSILFSPNSRGVGNACDAIKLFCTLGSFWDKFGMNKNEIAEMPYDDYVRLRMMMSNENESNRRKAKSGNGKISTAKIVGPGGKLRQSRGVRVPNR